MKNAGIFVVIAAVCAGATACKSGGASETAGATTAVAELKDHTGASFGRVKFTEKTPGVVDVEMVIDAKSSTTATEGEHAIHVHEGSECVAPSFASAKSHFNPTGAAHGGPEDAAHHAGDFGNIEIDKDRAGKKELSTTQLTLVDGQPQNAVGRTVIVHVKKDDFVTQQPPGNAGGRIACGIVTRE